MQELLKIIAQGLVEKPEEVSVTLDEPKEDGSVVYHLHVAEEDMGRVIGKQGRIAKAIRVVMRAAAAKRSLLRSIDRKRDARASCVLFILKERKAFAAAEPRKTHEKTISGSGKDRGYARRARRNARGTVVRFRRFSEKSEDPVF